MVLIAGRELKDEQGTREVGEDSAGSPLSQPELLLSGTDCFVVCDSLTTLAAALSQALWREHTCFIRVIHKVQEQGDAALVTE